MDEDTRTHCGSVDNGENTGAEHDSGTAVGAELGDDVAGREAQRARRLDAREHPRDLRAVRRALLAECRRVKFARIARYRRPWGEGYVEGFSIAFVETALRIFGNVAEERARVSDTATERVVLVAVTDLESNSTYCDEVRVLKTEETLILRDSSRFVDRARNSRGEFVYVVRSEDDDVRRREAMLVSLAIRSCGQRLIPRDLLLDAEARIKRTLEAHAAKHAPSERAWLAEQFASAGVPRDEMDRYLGHNLDEATPADLVELRKVLAMLEDDPGIWGTLLAHRRRQREAPPRGGSSVQADRVRRTVEATAGSRVTRVAANGGAAPC